MQSICIDAEHHFGISGNSHYGSLNGSSLGIISVFGRGIIGKCLHLAIGDVIYIRLVRNAHRHICKEEQSV